MRPWTFTTRVFIPLAILAMLAGCGGGGSSKISGTSGGSGGTGSTGAGGLVTSFGGVTPAGALNQYGKYAFTASAVDSDSARSVASFSWTFGDNTGTLSAPASGGSCSISHRFQASGALSVTVTAVDDQGHLGNVVTVPETVVAVTTPVSATIVSPTTATSLPVSIPGSVQTSFTVTAATTAPNATIGAANLDFYPGESGATIGTIVDNGGGSFTIPVIYQAASAAGSRIVTPTLTVSDSLGNSSAQVAFAAVTIATTSSNHPATVTITTPASSSTKAFTSKAVALTFNLADLDGDPVSYTVDWGDGTKADTGSTGTSPTGTGGVIVSLTHPYADSFASAPNANPATATVTVTANDSKTPSGSLNAASTQFVVAYNSYPTAAITSPQASGTLPTPTDLATGTVAGLVNPPTANSPQLVVIPILGQLSFNGAGTLPGSGDTALTYKWTFQNGTPATSTSANAGQVAFNGVAGKLTPCLVTFTVIDAFGRPSSGAPGANVHTFEKWVIVDGTNTQNFSLDFLYRQMGDGNIVASLNPVTTSANGLGATIEIFQDGISSSWAVQSASQASVIAPVRSNLPFNVLIPGFGNDPISYVLQIPNAPTGNFEDDTLVPDNPLPGGGGFSFQFPNATAAPWNPSLRIVTGQGFAPEGQTAANTTLFGTVNLNLIIGLTPVNSRWVDRLSVPLKDSTGAIQWEQDSNFVFAIPSILAYQYFAEWPVVPLTVDSLTVDNTDLKSITEGKPADMGFNLSYTTYTGDASNSQTFTTTQLQAFRVPSDSTTPYNLSNIAGAGWLTPSCTSALTPTTVPIGVPAFFNNMVYGTVGAAPLKGGLQDLPIPYDPNDPTKAPKAANYLRRLNGTRSVFSYSEYLWSKVWARPLVLNSAQLNYVDTGGLGGYTHFRYSNPPAWPKFVSSTGIVDDNSQFDLTAAGGPAFDNSSPVLVNDPVHAPSSTGVGRFFWTAYTPIYNAEGGAVISRTWLANGSTPPTTISGQNGVDAAAAFGFVPPQDTLVDKRGRNADGSLNGQNSGGYRVNWYNATQDSNGDPVQPDFWVVELNNGTAKVHFMLPAGYPTTQAPNAQVLTDAHKYLPSGHTFAAGPATTGGVVTDAVAPGYCWFDVPQELRPAAGTQPQITVFALKAILRNNAIPGARRLNRTEWIDSIKTATAQISILPNGSDVSYAHTIPFRYPWDIVVVNGPNTNVAE